VFGPLEIVGEIGSGGARDKIAVRVMTGWQSNHARIKARIGEASCELVRRSLTSPVVIVVKGNVDLTVRPVGQLVELERGELGSNAACGVAKTRLPKHGQIEETSTSITEECLLTDSHATRPPFEHGNSRCGNPLLMLRP
jgi:hypothetical protein